MRGIDKRFAGVAALSGAALEVRPRRGTRASSARNGGRQVHAHQDSLTGLPIRRRRGRGPCSTAAPLDARIAASKPDGGGISTIYQEINLGGYRSVAENICLGRGRAALARPARLACHEPGVPNAALARLGMEVDVRRPLAEHTTAVQQMVAIARALGFRARLVVMDEPTSSLDEREVEVLFGVIRRLKADGVSVVFVSHKLDELYAVCDRVTVMRDGRTVQVAPMARISKLDLVSAMLGREVAARDGRAHATAFGTRHAAGQEEVLAVEALHAPPRVQDATLRVGRGEIVGLAGLLGSGPVETRRARPSARRRPRPARAAPSASNAALRPRRPRRGDPRRASASARRTARPRASCPRCRCART
jgi:ribose transport system ATP-binding protein